MSVPELILAYLQVLAWPLVAVLILWSFRNEIRTLLNRLSRVALPGDVEFDFSAAVQDVAQLSQVVESEVQADSASGEAQPMLRLADANRKLVQMGLKPLVSEFSMAYYRDLALRDPTMALVALRLDLEGQLKNLAQWYGLPIQSGFSVEQLSQDLKAINVMTPDYQALMEKIMHLCQQAVHHPVSYQEASAVIAISTTLRNQFLTWLAQQPIEPSQHLLS